MLRSEADLDFEFLVWAIGEGNSACLNGVQAKRILTLCMDHRITGRALSRIRDVTDGPDMAAAIELLADQQEQNLQILEKQTNALKIIRTNYLTDKDNLVSLKGLSCYAYTRNKDHIRRTMDLDLLTEEPYRLAKALRKDNVKEYRNVSPHEIINAMVDQMGVDLHAHYPVWSVRENKNEQKSEKSTVIQHDLNKLTVMPFEFEEMIGAAKETDIFEVSGVSVPDPSASVLIICAHCYRDYLSFSSITVRTKPTLRFGDVAELRDYLNEPEFSAQRLLELANKTGALQAVNWMAQLLFRYSGDERLLKVLGVEAIPAEQFFKQYPRAVWGGFFAPLPDSYESFVTRKIPMQRIVSVLAGDIAPTPKEIRITGLDDIQPESLPVHVLAGAERTMPASLSVRMDNTTLRIVVEAPVLDRAVNSRVHIDVAGYPWEWNLDRGDDHITAKRSRHTPEPQTQFERTPQGYRLAYAMDIAALPQKISGDIYGFIGVGEFERSPIMQVGTLIPFRVAQTGITAS